MKLFIAGITLLYALTYPVSPAQAQETENRITFKNFLSGELRVAFLGIDLSEAKFIGDEIDWPGVDFIKSINPAWNNLLAYDLRKYRILPRALRLKSESVEYYHNICTIHNNELTFKDAIVPVWQSEGLNDDKIQLTLNTYDFAGLTGVGLMILIESFDAKNKIGRMTFTFLDLDTHKVIYSEKMSGFPGGTGPRKYWVETVHDVISQVQEIKYKEWKKEYLR